MLKPTKPHGLPVNVTLLPERLRRLGYATHIVGKLVVFLPLHFLFFRLIVVAFILLLSSLHPRLISISLFSSISFSGFSSFSVFNAYMSCSYCYSSLSSSFHIPSLSPSSWSIRRYTSLPTLPFFLSSSSSVNRRRHLVFNLSSSFI